MVLHLIFNLGLSNIRPVVQNLPITGLNTAQGSNVESVEEKKVLFKKLYNNNFCIVDFQIQVSKYFMPL